MSQADLTIQYSAHSAGNGGAHIFRVRKEDGDVAVHHRRHGDFCRLPGCLWLSAQRHSRLADAVPVFTAPY